jgi:hypothetical protein
LDVIGRTNLLESHEREANPEQNRRGAEKQAVALRTGQLDDRFQDRR